MQDLRRSMLLHMGYVSYGIRRHVTITRALDSLLCVCVSTEKLTVEVGGKPGLVQASTSRQKKTVAIHISYEGSMKSDCKYKLGQTRIKSGNAWYL